MSTGSFKKAAPTLPSPARRGRKTGGFTLLEVVVALAILAVSLTALLEVEASSLASAGRSRDVTIGAILARAKMVDLEKQLLDEGFTVGTSEEHGDFRDEGHEEYTWKATISEIKIDLSGLKDLCEGFGEKGGDQGGCDSMLGGFGAGFDLVTDSLAQSVRLVELTVTWPQGKFHESMSFRNLVSREELGTTTPGNLPAPGTINPTSPPPTSGPAK